MKIKYFIMLCMCIGTLYAETDRPMQGTDPEIDKMCGHRDGYRSLVFACEEIAKKYYPLFGLGWDVVKTNEKGEIYSSGGTIKLAVDLKDDDHAYRIFFDIMDIYVAAMKKYKPLHGSICKDFGAKNIDLALVFCSSKGEEPFYPKMSCIIKRENRMFANWNCPKGHPKYKGPLSSFNSELMNYEKMRKKYVNKGVKTVK